MRVGIDLARLIPGPAGGICPLLRGVWQTVFRLYPEHEHHVFCTAENRGLLEGAPEKTFFTPLPSANYYEQMDRHASERQLDVLFRAYPVYWRMNYPFARQVFLVPDLQHEIFPEFFTADVLRGRRMGFTQALSAAGAIGTISEYVRQTLQQHEFTVCDDIFLMSPACTNGVSEEPPTAAVLARLPTEDYFLYPANLWPHKNHRRVLEAFHRFLQRSGRRMQFVFTGHPEGWKQLRAEFPQLPIEHLGFVRVPLLRRLMQQARALVFFSLHEGFGMPLLEAFAAGTPVVCSDTTSLPEVGGDAVLSCAPTDMDAMAVLMARVVDDEPLRSQLVARGRQRLHAYSWEQSARNLFQALERVHKQAAEVYVLHEVTRPMVSIVTPSYNQGRFLARTIDSVLQQDYPHIEYVVMDGGSSDESIEILKSYGPRVSWVSEPDRGQTHAINKGFAQLHGTIRAYLNSDDVLLPGAVSTVVRHFDQHPEWDMIYGRAYYIDGEDRRIGQYNTRDYRFEWLMEDCCICQPAAFWRSRIANRVGPFDERLDYVMDYDYWIRMDRAGALIEHVPEFLACSRLHADAKTLSARYEIYQELFRTCMERAGYVCESHFHGFWHHLCHERPTGWARRLRGLPGLQQRMAYWHHKWYRNGGSVTALCRDAGRALVHRLIHVW